MQSCESGGKIYLVPTSEYVLNSDFKNGLSRSPFFISNNQLISIEDPCKDNNEPKLSSERLFIYVYDIFEKKIIIMYDLTKKYATLLSSFYLNGFILVATRKYIVLLNKQSEYIAVCKRGSTDFRIFKIVQRTRFNPEGAYVSMCNPYENHICLFIHNTCYSISIPYKFNSNEDTITELYASKYSFELPSWLDEYDHSTLIMANAKTIILDSNCSAILAKTFRGESKKDLHLNYFHSYDLCYKKHTALWKGNFVIISCFESFSQPFYSIQSESFRNITFIPLGVDKGRQIRRMVFKNDNETGDVYCFREDGKICRVQLGWDMQRLIWLSYLKKTGFFSWGFPKELIILIIQFLFEYQK